MAKTNIGLVNYAKGQLGRPYWMGTFGQVATEWLYTYNKGRLPNYYTASDFPSQYGKKVHDCIGLVKGYLWSDGPDAVPKYKASQDVDADSMNRLCVDRGDISTIPEIPGILVFSPSHVGVYIGGGEVIEARGHAYGVVKTKLKSRGWKSWGKCPWITYEEVKAAAPWYADAQKWVKAKGISTGDNPDAPCTRAEVWAMLMNMSNKE